MYHFFIHITYHHVSVSLLYAHNILFCICIPALKTSRLILYMYSLFMHITYHHVSVCLLFAHHVSPSIPSLYTSVSLQYKRSQFNLYLYPFFVHITFHPLSLFLLYTHHILFSICIPHISPSSVSQLVTHHSVSVSTPIHSQDTSEDTTGRCRQTTSGGDTP